MSPTSAISVGAYTVGRLTADPTAVRGAGGALSPALTLTVAAQFEPRPREQTLALVRLDVDVWLPSASGPTQLGSTLTAWGVGGSQGLWASIPAGSPTRHIELRLPLSIEQLALIERSAHQLGDSPLELELRFGASLAWVRETADAVPLGDPNHPLPASTGPVSDLWVIWETRVEAMRLAIPREHWAQHVLPALGRDRIRLVGVRLPAGDDGPARQVRVIFDAARREYDAGRHRVALQELRDLRHLIEEQLGAVDGKRVAAQVAALRGWPKDDPRQRFLDRAWQALADLTSAAHHRQGRVLAADESRLALVVTASLLEYIGDTAAPPDS